VAAAATESEIYSIIFIFEANINMKKYLNNYSLINNIMHMSYLEIAAKKYKNK